MSQCFCPVLYVDSERSRIEHSVSQLVVCLSAEGAKNISRLQLSPLQEWGSLTMALLGKFAYIWLNILFCYGSIPVPYGDWEGQWFEYSMSQLRFCLSTEGAKNVSWNWLFPLLRWGSLAMTFPGISFHYSLLKDMKKQLLIEDLSDI